MKEYKQHTEMELDLRELLVVIWSRKWIVIGLFCLAVLASYLLSLQMTKIYETTTMVMIREGGGVVESFGDQLTLLSGRSNKLATYSQLLKTRPILEAAIEKLDLRNEDTGELIPYESLKGRINIKGERETNLMTITVSYPDPNMARDIANTLVAVFQDENLKMNRADLQSASSFIDSQLQEVSSELTQLELKLLNYKTEHGVVYPTEQGKATLNKLIQMETARAQAFVELGYMQANLSEMESYFYDQEREIITSRTISNNPEVRELQNRLLVLELDLTGLLAVYTEGHPTVVELKKKIDEVNMRLGLAVEKIISSQTEAINPLYTSLQDRIITMQCNIIAGQRRLEIYDRQIDVIAEELNLLPKEELALLRLERENRVMENIYLLLMEKQAEIQVQEAMQTSDLVIVSPAVASNKPIQPRPKVNMAIAGVLALMVSIGIIFFLEFLDTTIKSDKDIIKATDLPVLGLIPDLDKVDNTRGYGGDGSA